MTILTDPIQWYEGMLLMPQHFQQSDLRGDQLLSTNVRNLQPFYWGVMTLEFDHSLLVAGIFRPTALQVMMPDGLFIQDALASDPHLQLDLTPSKKIFQKGPSKIWLCVPELRGDPSDVVGALPRFHSVDVGEVQDVNTGEEDVPMPRLYPNLSLVLGDSPPAHHVGIPLGEVTYDTKSFALTPYIPPVVSLAHSDGLQVLINGTAEKLRQKLGYLQQKIQGGLSASSATSPYLQEVESTRLKIIAGLVPFEAALAVGNAHPLNLFLALSGVVGQLAGVKFGEMPPRFKAYDHNDILASISQLTRFIDNVLDEIQESYSIEPFVQQDRLFTLALKPSWISDNFILGARAQAGMTDDDLINWIQNAVMVTDRFVESAKDTRILGAARTIVDEVSALNLVSNRGMRLFLVENDPDFIDPKGVLCLFNMSDSEGTRPMEIVLYNANPLASTLSEG